MFQIKLMKNRNTRIIAFYLPQFHPIPENDEWWGKGFTEWTNVGKAKSLFKGHNQPKVPKDLGYYDLRMPEIREAQAKMAHEAGIEGFMYWHYWFGQGKKLLNLPLDEVIKSQEPDFPFCLGWANHSWYSKNWNKNDTKGEDKLLIEQTYPGMEDYKAHFYNNLPAFKDHRYLKVNQKCIFLIYAPFDIPNISLFIKYWRELAYENGLKGIHFVGSVRKNSDCDLVLSLGFDAVCRTGIEDAHKKIKGKGIKRIIWEIKKRTQNSNLEKFNYSDIVENLLEPELDKRQDIYPCLVPNFDHTPRSGNNGLVYINSTPFLFKRLLNRAIKIVSQKKNDNQVIFLRSWNEWAEGNYIEPDLDHGDGYLKALKSEVLNG